MSNSREIMKISGLNERSPILIRTGNGAVSVSVNDVLHWIAPGAPPQEAFKHLIQCQARGIHPFLGHAHLANIDGKWITIVDKSGWLKLANEHPQYDGHQCGIVIQEWRPAKPGRPATRTEPAQPPEPEFFGETREIEGTIRPEGWRTIGGWARVYRKDHKYPTYKAVSVSEYANTVSRSWKRMGNTMICKVALVQGLQESGVVNSSGVYDSAEFPNADIDVESESLSDRDTIDVEIEESPSRAALPPREKPAPPVEYTPPDDLLGSHPKLLAKLGAAIAGIGMTDYQVKAMLARRGVTHESQLTVNDAVTIISKLEFEIDRRNAGKTMLPDAPDADEEEEPNRNILKGETPEVLSTVEGDIVNDDGEVVGTARTVANKEGFRLTDNGHKLHTSDTHGCDPERTPQNCPVCDYGLDVCAVCGAAEIELNEPCPGKNTSPSEPPEAYAIQRVRDINQAYQRWRQALERMDVQVATGIVEGIIEAYGESAVADWGLAESFEIANATRREDKPAPPKRSRKKGD